MPDSGPRVSTGMSSSGQAYRSAEYVRPPNEGVVVDLSKYADALINYEDISSRLTDDEERRIVEVFVAELDQLRPGRSDGRDLLSAGSSRGSSRNKHAKPCL